MIQYIYIYYVYKIIHIIEYVHLLEGNYMLKS